MEFGVMLRDYISNEGVLVDLPWKIDFAYLYCVLKDFHALDMLKSQWQHLKIQKWFMFVYEINEWC